MRLFCNEMSALKRFWAWVMRIFSLQQSWFGMQWPHFTRFCATAPLSATLTKTAFWILGKTHIILLLKMRNTLIHEAFSHIAVEKGTTDLFRIVIYLTEISRSSTNARHPQPMRSKYLAAQKHHQQWPSEILTGHPCRDMSLPIYAYDALKLGYLNALTPLNQLIKQALGEPAANSTASECNSSSRAGSGV